MLTVIIFILVLSLLVFVHELGHFIFAKLSGMRVDEFGIGFPPRIFSWKRGETKYSINWLLFGGFVKIHGEDQSQPLPGPDRVRSFGARPRYLQALVMVAGVAFNVLFAWILTSGGFLYGLPVSADFASGELRDVKVIVTEVVAGSPAEHAGLVVGDEVISLATSSAVSFKPTNVSDVQNFIAHSNFKPITVNVTRVAEATSTVVVPVAGIIADVPAIGIGLDAVGILSLPIHKALWQGARLTYFTFTGTTIGLIDFVHKAFTEKGTLKHISGPVGIAHLVGDARQLGLSYFISFVSFISINLAVINIIPFPALDGGRLLFVIIESVIRRPIPARVSVILNTAGFGLLMLFMLFITYNDIFRLFAR